MTWGPVTRKLDTQSGSSVCKTRQGQKFEFDDSIAKSKGGVLECAFEKGKLVGKGNCTFYGPEYNSPLLGGNKLRCKDCKDFRRGEMHVISFEGKIEWPFQHGHADCHRLTWADINDRVIGQECTSGHCVLILGNGEGPLL